MIREMWRASASPRIFFEGLEPKPSAIFRGAFAAAISFGGLGSACGFGLVRATGSDAYLPVLLFSLLVAATLFLYTWGFASLFVQRPGALDVRAWEVSGWSWSPGFFAALSMVVPLLIFPLPALLVTLTATLIWHLHLLRVGLSVFLERPAWRVVIIYTLFIYAFPAVLFAGILWFAQQAI